MGLAESLDNAISDFFGSWDIFSTLLLVLLLTVVMSPLLTTKDPDVHPFLLARQSTPSPIRQKGESAVYRSLDVPHGYPLRNSLGVKDPDTPKWSPGRKGDLRDIWRQATRGPPLPDGQQGPSSPDSRHDSRGFGASRVGKLITVLGREKTISHDLSSVTAQINAFGSWAKKENVSRVAVGVCNSVELLVVLFAASFYDFSLTLIPYGLPEDEFIKLVAMSEADALVAEAGTFGLDSLFSKCKVVSRVVLTTRGVSEHMAFDEPTDKAPRGVAVSTWDSIVEGGEKNKEVLPVDKESTVQPIRIFVSTGRKGLESVEYTNENIISAVAALLATATRDIKLSPTDTLLPTTSLADPYTLCWTLAALFSNAAVALNSVAGEKVDLALATAGHIPTVIIAAPKTVKNYIFETIKSGLGPGGVARYFQNKSLTSGVMPMKRPVVKLTSLSRLRLLLIGQPVWERTRLTSAELHELRLLTGSRIGYALTAPEVAGAVAQTNLQDYRDKGEVVSVGPPLGSVEVHVVGEDEKMGSVAPQGKIVVKGPAVVGGTTELDVIGRVAEDNTLSLV